MPSGQPKTITQTTQQSSGPTGAAVPMWDDLFKRTTAALDATNNNPYTGEFLAQTGGDFTNAVNSLRGIMPGVASGAQEFKDMGVAQARGDYLNPETNPFLAAAGAAAIRPVQQQFREMVMPNLIDQGVMQGAFSGGSGQGELAARAGRDLSTVTSDTLAKMYAQNYANERQIQQGTGAILAQGNELLSAPGQLGFSIDEKLRQSQQLGIDNAIQRWQMGQTAPWYGLGEAANLINSAGYKSSSGTSTAPNPNYVDPFTNALKVGLGAVSTGASLFGSGGLNMLAPMGARMMGGIPASYG